MNTQIKEDMNKELHIELAALESRITYPLDHKLETEILELQAMVRELEASFSPEEKLSRMVAYYSPYKQALLSQ